MILVAGNTVFGQTATNFAGIDLNGGANATENVVHNNYDGIDAVGDSVTFNLVYNNSNVGIEGDGGGTTLTGNVVYSNNVGIKSNTATNSAAGPFVKNNLVYNNTAQGIWLIGGSSAQFYNNTVYQPAGDAIRIDAGNPNAAGIQIQNNILWTQNGYDIMLDPTSTAGFKSDYNDLYVTGSGAIGPWQNVVQTALQNWTTASGDDADSISADPLFDSVVTGDFHEMSTTGSYHGDSLPPLLGSGGLPVFAPAVATADSNESPAIDRGNATFAPNLEPAPNGGYINQGAYGDTTQASLSPAHFLFVTNPLAGQTAATGLHLTVVWRDEISNTGAGASADRHD